MMGPFVYVVLGSTKDITLGPTAIMSLIVAGAANGSIPMAIALSFVAGCMQILMGLLRLGFLVDFISFPVISGFTSSAALNIAFGQVKVGWVSLYRMKCPVSQATLHRPCYPRRSTHDHWLTVLVPI